MKLLSLKNISGRFGKTAICMAMLFSFSSFQGNNTISEPTIKALFLYNFTKYIDWPENPNAGHFVIGFFGASIVMEELKQVTAGKQAKGLDIEIKNFSDMQGIEKCRILFIPQNQCTNMKKILEVTAGKGVLVVTEQKGMALKGAAINIIEKEEKIRFELNETAVKQAQLKVSSQLMSLAIVVNKEKSL